VLREVGGLSAQHARVGAHHQDRGTGRALIDREEMRDLVSRHRERSTRSRVRVVYARSRDGRIEIAIENSGVELRRDLADRQLWRLARRIRWRERCAAAAGDAGRCAHDADCRRRLVLQWARALRGRHLRIEHADGLR